MLKGVLSFGTVHYQVQTTVLYSHLTLKRHMSIPDYQTLSIVTLHPPPLHPDGMLVHNRSPSLPPAFTQGSQQRSNVRIKYLA